MLPDCSGFQRPDIWRRLPRLEWPKSWAKFVRTPTCWTSVGMTVRGSSIGIWVGKSTKLWMFVCSWKTRIILIGFRGWNENGWKEPEHGLHVENLMKNVVLDEPTSFLDHVSLECTQRECQPNEVLIKEYKEMFESRISAGVTEKLPGWEKASRENGCVVSRHGRTCSKIRRGILWTGKKESGGTLQSLKHVLGWSSNQAGRTRIS